MITFILGLLIGGIGTWLYLTQNPKGAAFLNDFVTRQSETRSENLARVLALVSSKGVATSAEIEKSLGISEATVQAYLQELVQQGRLEQTGEEGKPIAYRLRA